MADDEVTEAAASEGDGIAALRTKLERRSRSVPPPRRPRNEPANETGGGRLSSDGEAAAPPVGETKPSTTAPRAPRAQRSRAPDPERPSTGPNEPGANLVVRIRRSVDDRLVELLHAFRQEGVRLSKVELVELLIWELPPKPTAELRQRISTFRQKAPREAPL